MSLTPAEIEKKKVQAKIKEINEWLASAYYSQYGHDEPSSASSISSGWREVYDGLPHQPLSPSDNDTINYDMDCLRSDQEDNDFDRITMVDYTQDLIDLDQDLIDLDHDLIDLSEDLIDLSSPELKEPSSFDP